MLFPLDLSEVEVGVGNRFVVEGILVGNKSMLLVDMIAACCFSLFPFYSCRSNRSVVDANAGYWSL
jgi:hypothetical protein